MNQNLGRQWYITVEYNDGSRCFHGINKITNKSVWEPIVTENTTLYMSANDALIAYQFLTENNAYPDSAFLKALSIILADFTKIEESIDKKAMG